MRPRTSQTVRGPACSLCDIIKFGYFHQIRLLISKGINLDSRDNSKRTPLILCAFMEPEDWGVSIAMTLIEKDVYVGERDCFGRNVLHYACIYERKNLVRVVLRAIDFDLNQADILGNTALHYAAMSGNETITELIALSYKKYLISASKVNHQRRTALGEAIAAGNTSCAHAIELTLGHPGSSVKDVRFAEDVILRSNSSSRISQTALSLSKGKASRPKSAAFPTRLDSASSVCSPNHERSPISLRSRSSSTIRANDYHRKSQNPLYAYGCKRDDDVIHCASKEDFRNKPDYVCKLVNLPAEPHFWEQVSMLDSANQNSSWADTCSTSQAYHNGTGWRQEMEQLFKVYEHQCSASWRATKACDKQIPTLTSSPGPEEDDKSKKGRTVVSRNVHGKDSSPEPKKRVSSVRLRKMVNGKLTGGTSVDGSLDTSSESITSTVSSKRRGLEREISMGRSESLATKQRVKSAKETNSRVQSPATSSPSLAPTSSSPTERSRVGKTASQPANIKTSLTPPPKTDTKQETATSASFPAPAGASATSPSHTQKMAATENSSPTVNNKENLPPSKNSASATPPKIPVVKETLIADDRQESSTSCEPQVDTSKLWVQNPYENNDDADEKDGAGD